MSPAPCVFPMQGRKRAARGGVTPRIVQGSAFGQIVPQQATLSIVVEGVFETHDGMAVCGVVVWRSERPHNDAPGELARRIVLAKLGFGGMFDVCESRTAPQQLRGDLARRCATRFVDAVWPAVRAVADMQGVAIGMLQPGGPAELIGQQYAAARCAAVPCEARRRVLPLERQAGPSWFVHGECRE